MEEGQPPAVEDQDALRDQDLGVAAQVAVVKNRFRASSRCRSLIASARAPTTSANRRRLGTLLLGSRGLPIPVGIEELAARW